MKTLYISTNNNILIDTENNTCNTLKRSRQGIDDIFLVKEPMHVIYGYNDKHHEADVEPNDIIVTFYADEFDKRMIVVKNEDWANNLIAYEKKEQEEKERWAKSQAEKCCDCDNCAKEG